MKTAFSAFVFGDYEKFIPFYVYSIHKNYPDSDIIIFYHSNLSSHLKESLKRYKQLTIYENFYQEYKSFKNLKFRGGGGLTILRYLIPGVYFKDYDAVYFGDVDILILEEKEALFDFHLKQANACNLPFSNKVRALSDGGLSNRLTGLHFVKVKPYFEKLNPIIEKFLNDKNWALDYLKNIERDEQLLYKLNKTAFNFNPMQVAENERPWHGFHLGVVRDGNFLNKKQISENSSLNYNEIRSQLEGFAQTKNFKTMMHKVFCPELFFTFKYFDVNMPYSLKVKYGFTQLYRNVSNRVIQKLYRKLKNGPNN